MALRNLRYDTDPILHKKAAEVTNIDEKIQVLIDDMFETMEKFYGVGLAAPQVGISRRVIVIDTGEENERFALINPVVTKFSKETCDLEEGCLSYPGLFGMVERSTSCEVKALDRNGKEITIKAKGLLAQALQHEINHIDGIVFTDLAKEGTYFTYGKNDKVIKNVYYDEKQHRVMLNKPNKK